MKRNHKHLFRDADDRAMEAEKRRLAEERKELEVLKMELDNLQQGKDLTKTKPKHNKKRKSKFQKDFEARWKEKFGEEYSPAKY